MNTNNLLLLALISLLINNILSISTNKHKKSKSIYPVKSVANSNSGIQSLSQSKDPKYKSKQFQSFVTSGNTYGVYDNRTPLHLNGASRSDADRFGYMRLKESDEFDLSFIEIPKLEREDHSNYKNYIGVPHLTKKERNQMDREFRSI